MAEEELDVEAEFDSQTSVRACIVSCFLIVLMLTMCAGKKQGSAS